VGTFPYAAALMREAVDLDAPVANGDAAASVGDTEPAADGSIAPPLWLELIAFAAAAGLLAYGGLGLLLAINGWYRPVVVFVLGTAGLIVLLVGARAAGVFAPGAGEPRASRRSAHVYAAVGIVAIVGITGLNVKHASHHVLINRDGGAYVTAGRWIARDGSLEIDAKNGPFDNQPSLRFSSWAVSDDGDGNLQIDFAHLLPAVLAQAFAIGGERGLLHAPALLGGVVLLAFFVLAWRLIRRPLFALSAALALGLVIPQVSFTRDAYSEIPTQILLFTALWLLVGNGKRFLPSPRVALLAGLFLGATQMARIDALLHLAGVPLLCGIAWLANRQDPVRRRSTTLAIGALFAGMLPGLLIGFWDVIYRSGTYWDRHSDEVYGLVGALFASVLATLVMVAVWPPVARRLPAAHRQTLGRVVGVFVAAAGIGVWLLRPHLFKTHGRGVPVLAGLQQREGLPVDITRTYYEQSLTWMQWYLGPLTIALALLACGFLANALIQGRYKRALASLAVLGPGSLLYLYEVNAVPDHVWTDRRFLVSAIPALILLALGLAAELFASGARAHSRAWVAPVVRVAAVAAAVVVVAYPFNALRPVSEMTEEYGFNRVIGDVCQQVGPDAAIVYLEFDDIDLYDDWAAQSLRSWCGADVAIMRRQDAPLVRQLAQDWEAQGRTLLAVGARPISITRVLPDAQVIPTRVAINERLLEPTLERRPSGYTKEQLSLAVARVQP
jgi:hypothetical protein